MYQAYSFKLFSRVNKFLRAKSVFMIKHLFKVNDPIGPNQALVHDMRGTQDRASVCLAWKRYVPRDNVTTSRWDIELSSVINNQYCEVVDRHRHLVLTKLHACQFLAIAVVRVFGHLDIQKMKWTRMRPFL